MILHSLSRGGFLRRGQSFQLMTGTGIPLFPAT